MGANKLVSVWGAWTLVAVFSAVMVTLTITAQARGSFTAPPNTSESFFIKELSEGLFLNASKAKEILDEGHSIILIKAYDAQSKRPRLAAAKQAGASVSEIESGWFQPSLVYLMESERIVISKTSKNQIAVSGISKDTLRWMAYN